MTTEHHDPPADDTVAAELALGVLDGDERAAALRRLIADPAFARDVERWRDHFATLFANVAEEQPPERTWHAVERAVDGPRQVATSGASNPWKPMAIAASLAALAMTAVALRPPATVPVTPPPVATAPLVAAMALSGGAGTQPALYDADAGTVKMPGPMPIPTGKDAQLWAIVGSKPPVPLGTFKAVGPGAYVADARLAKAIAAGTTLAITLEPVGGSPSGKPTGPIIASGALVRI